jgi:hypothetical protein
MPQILVIADEAAHDGEPPTMFRERVSVTDFESDHFATQLVERLGWAVGDADELNQRSRPAGQRRRLTASPSAATTAAPAGRSQRAPRSASVVTTAS